MVIYNNLPHHCNAIQLFFRDAYFRGKVVWSVVALGVMIILFFLLIAKLAVIECWVRACDLHAPALIDFSIVSFSVPQIDVLSLWSMCVAVLELVGPG